MAQYRARDEVEFFDTKSLSVATASVALTERNSNADYALITITGDQIYWNPSGLVATTTHHLASIGDVIELEGPANIKNFRAIQVTGTSTLRISYGRFVRPT